MNEQDFNDGKLISEIVGICNVWNTSETNARLRKFINDFRTAVLKEAAERLCRKCVAFSSSSNACLLPGKTCRDYEAILGDQAKTFMGLPVFDSQPAGPMLGMEPSVMDAVQKNFMDMSGSNELLKQRGVTYKTTMLEPPDASFDCPTCAESVDGQPGNSACQQCREESDVNIPS